VYKRTLLSLLCITAWAQQPSSQPSTKNGEWPYYTADLKGTKYSPAVTQNPAVERLWTALLRGRKLRLPWRMASGNRQPRKGAPNAGAGKREWRTPITTWAIGGTK